MTDDFDKKLDEIITQKLDNMPNYEEYMVNSTMKVLLIPEIKKLVADTLLKAIGEKIDLYKLANPTGSSAGNHYLLVNSPMAIIVANGEGYNQAIDKIKSNIEKELGIKEK